MGGPGSGRHWYIGAKETTDNFRDIDVRYLRRHGLLRSGRSFTLNWLRRDEVVASIGCRTDAGSVTLTYRHRVPGDNWEDVTYPIRLDWTACHLGGQRPWFLCPALGCGRRVAVLYGGATFACRHCHQLAYGSQREQPDDRAIRRADRIRETLGWEPGILNGPGPKPTGMHWRTYRRLLEEHDRLVNVAIAGAHQRLGIAP